METDIFKRHLREFYPLITKLICCDQVHPTLQKHGFFVFHCKSAPSILSCMLLLPISFEIIAYNARLCWKMLICYMATILQPTQMSPFS